MNTDDIVADGANHRTRTGAQRREKTRVLLIHKAVEIFAQKGADAPVIDDFIGAAGVARGTFYNYFRTTAELLTAVAAEMNDEVLALVDPLLQPLDDPAVRIATGTRLYVGIALRYTIWGHFLTRIGSRHTVRGKLMDVYLARDIEQGIATGRFPGTDSLVARDMILGTIFYAIETLLTEAGHEDHAERMLCAVLRGLGLSAAQAQQIAYMPLPALGRMNGPIFSLLKAP